MCEADAYMVRDGREELILKSVDVVEPQDDGSWRLVGIFGDQAIVHGRIQRLTLVEHKILFET
jgi:predicted RNA-binding protein